MGTQFVRGIQALGKVSKKTLVIGGKLFCLAHVIGAYVHPSIAIGQSMVPTINASAPGTLLLAETVSTSLGKAGPGDVVLLRSSQDCRNRLCKRIIAKEGQTVTFQCQCCQKEKTLIVPKGHIWIEGDNKKDSHDSRCFGPVPYGLVQARLFWKVWPLKEFGPLD